MQERSPPCIEDFLYICDDAYKKEELISMEASILQTLSFDINIPIPYRFLRRYAKVRVETFPRMCEVDIYTTEACLALRFYITFSQWTSQRSSGKLSLCRALIPTSSYVCVLFTILWALPSLVWVFASLSPQCVSAGMDTLTLARYYCEMSLMDMDLAVERGSLVASACLLMALVTKDLGGWVGSHNTVNAFQINVFVFIF